MRVAGFTPCAWTTRAEKARTSKIGASGPRLGGKGRIGIGTIVLALVAMYFGIDPSVVLQMAEGPATHEQAPPARRRSTPTRASWPRSWRNRRHLGRHLHAKPQPQLRAARWCCFAAPRPRLRHRPGRHGPVLPSRRQQGVHRPRLLRRVERCLNAPGDFAQAYVIAHEGGAPRSTCWACPNRSTACASAIRPRPTPCRCAWNCRPTAPTVARRAHILESGDIEEGLNAASAIGDDTCKRRARAMLCPTPSPHGSSAQRVRWFKRGLESGDLRQCDTFGAAQL